MTLAQHRDEPSTPVWLDRLVSRVIAHAREHVTFDADAHAYTTRGRSLRGVSEVMKSQGYIDGSFHDESHATRGRYVHEATLLIDHDDLDFARVPPPYLGYCASYEAALAAYRPVQLLREQVVADTVLGFAGTADRLWLLPSGPAVVDFKAGVAQRWHGVQLAGYKRGMLAMFGEKPPRTIDRYVLYLHRDGACGRLVPYTDTRDDAFFVAALTCCNFRSEFTRG